MLRAYDWENATASEICWQMRPLKNLISCHIQENPLNLLHLQTGRIPYRFRKWCDTFLIISPFKNGNSESDSISTTLTFINIDRPQITTIPGKPTQYRILLKTKFLTEHPCPFWIDTMPLGIYWPKEDFNSFKRYELCKVAPVLGEKTGESSQWNFWP